MHFIIVSHFWWIQCGDTGRLFEGNAMGAVTKMEMASLLAFLPPITDELPVEYIFEPKVIQLVHEPGAFETGTCEKNKKDTTSGSFWWIANFPSKIKLDFRLQQQGRQLCFKRDYPV